MKKPLTTILLVLTILIVAGVAFVPHQAEAGAIGAILGNLFGGSAGSAIGNATEEIAMFAIDSIAADIGNLILKTAAWFLSIAGIILNISIILTMNIKAIYEATPAIEQIWVVIRNISSIFIIFGLLYTSILTILDIGGANLKTLVRNIVIAGLLINFSLFFTKLLIDGSNLVSLQFYRAIAPNSQNASITKGGIAGILDKSFTDGGISDVFMSSLQITKIYDKNTHKSLLKGDTGGSVFFKIFIATISGSAMMILAAFSFLAASIAFVIRLVILLLLMGFSPVYFAGMIFPAIKKDISDRWENYLRQQLIFMPVYLLFMYVALRFISTINTGDTEKGFFEILGKAQANAANSSSGGIFLSNVGIMLQYTIAFILINIPLMAALKTGGESAKWGDDAKKWVSGRLGGIVGRNTAGRLGRRLGGAFDSVAIEAQKTSFGRGASSVLRAIGVSQDVRGGFSSMEKGKYGSKQSLEDIQKEDKERARVISGIQRSKTQMSIINSIVGDRTAPPTSEEMTTFRSTITKMSNTELEKIDFDTLTDSKFASSLSSSQTEKLLDGSSLTESQKDIFKEKRKQELVRILSSGNAEEIAAHMKNLSGKELATKIGDDILQKYTVIDHLTPSQLVDMGNLKRSTKKIIGDYIDVRGVSGDINTDHPAFGYIVSHKKEWS